MEAKRAKKIKELVKERYGTMAREALNCCAPSVSRATTQAERLYTKEELKGLPDTVTGPTAGCGNPVALGELKPGDVVLDLGSGGGIDCFLASRKVGGEGKVIGLDMTPDMIRLARENAEKIGASNVEFRLGEMEHMPVETNSVDVIISNCVICLSPDKDGVFREAFRVLKPYQVGKAVLEATRNWGLIYDWLEEILDDVALAHPLKVRAIAEARIKTDKISADILCDLLRSNFCLKLMFLAERLEWLRTS